ncbi:MAG TPA: penicillin acylase family protein [Sphingomonas sp.]|jgi:acyl-homoserine-lactone acylase
MTIHRVPLFILAALATPAIAAPDTKRDVTIVRDDHGIAHVTGKTDADAVFGAIYAQAEDDFPRIEANYLTALGRTAEAEGESAIWQDLRQRLFVDPAVLQAQYRASPTWLRTLMTAWADGLNYYLATHPVVKPRVLTRFEPWMALSFTEGSIGGDIERISLTELAAFYGNARVAPTAVELGMVPQEPRGSNGIAIAPANTADGRTLLLINPHTSFYFRSEVQMRSGEGLDAYGASTWGQFFIYQGFNPRIGWMHTSSGVDVVDEFAETIVPRRDARLAYRYGRALRPVIQRPVTIGYRGADGRLATRSFATLHTHHGPIVAARGNRWIATALMWRPVAALEQSWLRTKTRDVASFVKVSARQANSSNATILADAAGRIAYLHPQFVPRRDDRFDYTHAVDGADPATDWHGLHSLASLPQAVSPRSGYVVNTNNWPWTAAGANSPRAANFPRYMDGAGQNARGVHAELLLKDRRDFTAERLMTAAYDSYLPAFAVLIPQLVAAHAALPEADPRRGALAAPIALLKEWDDRWSATSTPTALAVFWGDALWRQIGPAARAAGINVPDYIATRVSAEAKLAALAEAVATLRRDFGDWRVPWGEINRFQRLDGAIGPHFDDRRPSTPVPFTSAQWGSLASFGAKSYPNTRRYYGTSGNSFVAVVSLGQMPQAWAVMAGGQSGDPASSHFADQIDRYAGGKLRPIYLTPADLAGHVERTYRPGE